MSAFLTAEWRKLIMVQYVVKPKLLMPYLPRGVELDLFHSRTAGRSLCYVSLVAFYFDKVRVKGLAVPLHTCFEEINLRFYVRRREADGSVKRGVVFIREFVPRWAIAWAAKRFYEEPYFTIPTRHEISRRGGPLTAKYGWKRGGRWHTLSAVAYPAPEPVAPRSLEEFITEHYWGYTKRSDGTTSAYRVEHPRWQTYRVQSYEIAVDFEKLYGPEFGFLTERWVSNVLLAEGSTVTVHSGSRLSTAPAVLPA